MTALDRFVQECTVVYLSGAAVRIIHDPTGLSAESWKHPVQSMNVDYALSELRMEVETNPNVGA